MAYTSNPFVGKVRRQAVNDVRIRGLSYSVVALKYGVVRSTICKWVKKASLDTKTYIPTLSSKPHSPANRIDPELEVHIISLREKVKRCTPILHAHLLLEGLVVSQSTVARVLRRHQLTRKRRAKFLGGNLPRPLASSPGELVQVDTIHFVRPNGTRIYVYVAIDVYSRLGYAEYHPKLSQRLSFKTIKAAQIAFGFRFKMVQTDNGPEFGQRLLYWLWKQNTKLRHSRVRKPNDNAHVERFIRTIQEECLYGKLSKEQMIPKYLEIYLKYYNNERLHLGINCQTPRQFVSKVLN